MGGIFKDKTYKEIWEISYPIILGGVAQTAINITDSAFLGRISEVALGASAIAGLFYVTFMMLGYGFGVGVQIIIARLNGERKYALMGNVLDHSLYFLTLLSFILFVIMHWGGPYLLSYFVKSEGVLEASVTFIKVRSYAIFFSSFVFVIRSFFTGIAQTKVVFYTTAIVAVLNVLFNYILVFGHWGFPRMEIAGSAWASTIAEFVAAVFILIYTIKTVDLKKYKLFALQSFNFNYLKEVLYTAAPVMLQMFIALTSWFIFFMIIEQMGERPLAISNIIRNAYMILMIPLMGFGSATNTLVSTLIGEKKYNQVFVMIKKISIMSFVISLIVMLILNIMPEIMLGIFTNNDELIKASIPSLRVIDGSLLMYSVSTIVLSAVSGSGNTLMSLIIEIVTIIFYLFATYLVAVRWELPIEWVWSVEYIYFFFMGIMPYAYLKYAQKRNFFN
ncbi:MAG: MATE family efflux transporter [Bacteroidia bacterium]|nr:MATE family efflux transporter [Bacteroidia bacterium]MCZ2248243.1 MATE family efflux transporter [Bacteroidia bacterium]